LIFDNFNQKEDQNNLTGINYLPLRNIGIIESTELEEPVVLNYAVYYNSFVSAYLYELTTMQCVEFNVLGRCPLFGFYHFIQPDNILHLLYNIGFYGAFSTANLIYQIGFEEDNQEEENQEEIDSQEEENNNEKPRKITIRQITQRGLGECIVFKNCLTIGTQREMLVLNIDRYRKIEFNSDVTIEKLLRINKYDGFKYIINSIDVSNLTDLTRDLSRYLINNTIYSAVGNYGTPGSSMRDNALIHMFQHLLFFPIYLKNNSILETFYQLQLLDPNDNTKFDDKSKFYHTMDSTYFRPFIFLTNRVEQYIINEFVPSMDYGMTYPGVITPVANPTYNTSFLSRNVDHYNKIYYPTTNNTILSSNVPIVTKYSSDFIMPLYSMCYDINQFILFVFTGTNRLLQNTVDYIQLQETGPTFGWFNEIPKNVISFSGMRGFRNEMLIIDGLAYTKFFINYPRLMAYPRQGNAAYGYENLVDIKVNDQRDVSILTGIFPIKYIIPTEFYRNILFQIDNDTYTKTVIDIPDNQYLQLRDNNLTSINFAKRTELNGVLVSQMDYPIPLNVYIDYRNSGDIDPMVNFLGNLHILKHSASVTDLQTLYCDADNAKILEMEKEENEMIVGFSTENDLMNKLYSKFFDDLKLNFVIDEFAENQEFIFYGDFEFYGIHHSAIIDNTAWNDFFTAYIVSYYLPRSYATTSLRDGNNNEYDMFLRQLADSISYGNRKNKYRIIKYSYSYKLTYRYINKNNVSASSLTNENNPIVDFRKNILMSNYYSSLGELNIRYTDVSGMTYNTLYDIFVNSYELIPNTIEIYDEYEYNGNIGLCQSYFENNNIVFHTADSIILYNIENKEFKIGKMPNMKGRHFIFTNWDDMAKYFLANWEEFFQENKEI
jgi:hypothetical protein